MKTGLTAFLVISAAPVLLLSGCGKSENSATTAPSASAASGSWPGMEADLQRTLKQQSNFYVFKTAADFKHDTAGLTWKDGTDLPPFADTAAKQGGTLTQWLEDYPDTFRVIGPNDNGSFRSYIWDYTELVSLRPHPDVPGQYYPELARTWAVDKATKTVYIRLDPDARWSDGEPVTTDDVVFSWYFYRSPQVQEPWYNDFYTKTFTHLTVYGKYDYAVTLPELKPDIEDRAGDVQLFPKHFFADFGPGWAQRHDWKITPTTGAYTIDPNGIRRQVSVTLRHVPNWWAQNKRFMRGRFNPDQVRLVVVHDPDKAFEEFVRGDLDLFPLTRPELWYDKLPNNAPSVASGFTVKATVYNVIPVPDYGLWINESRPILDNRDVRVGIQYATDFALVCQRYFRGDATLQQNTSDGYSFNANPSLHPRPFDPAKAREAFARAGFTRQGPDGILLDASGRRLAFTITNNYRNLEDVLTILKEQAVKAGLEFDIETPDATTAFEKIEEKHHDIAFMAYSRSVEPYPRYWENFAGDNAYDHPYLPDGSPNPQRKPKANTNNLTCIAIPELDRLIKRYDDASSMEEIKALAAPIEKIIWDDAGWVPGFKIPFYRMGYRPWVKWSQEFAPMQALDFQQYWTMWIDQDAEKADQAAKAQGRSLPVQILTYDKYKEKE